jgi:hypothetical protein
MPNEALPPLGNLGCSGVQPLCHLLDRDALSRHQDDLSALHQTPFALALADPRPQNCFFLVGEPNFGRS